MRENKRRQESVIILPPFPEYFDFATRSRTKSSYSIGDLYATYASFGLSYFQMRAAKDVGYVYKIFDFQKEGRRIGSATNQPTTIDLATARAIAVFCYFGFNIACITNKPGQPTYEEHFPAVVRGVDHTQNSLQQYPDILSEFPELKSKINNPIMPDNLSKKIRLPKSKFNPSLYMNKKQEPLSNSSDKPPEPAAIPAPSDEPTMKEIRDAILEQYYKDSPHLEGTFGSQDGGYKEVDW